MIRLPIYLKLGTAPRAKLATVEAEGMVEVRVKIATVLRATADLIEVNADE